MKCEQMGIKNINDYLDEILKLVHSKITKKKFITENKLEDLIKRVID